MTADASALRMRNVSKRFPGTLAVDCVDFDVRRGEVHALMGENGAGKSTLMHILAGSFDDYTGSVEVNGQAVQLHSPAQARACGIAMVYQELSCAPSLSIAENVLAGRLPCRFGGFIDRRKMLDEARDCIERVGLRIDPQTAVEDISQHEAQLVEIARALGDEPSILVMDEPTSALSREEVDRLFEIIARLKQGGLAIIFISHHLPEVFRVADRVTVLRDGRLVGAHDIGDVTRRSVVEMMIGGAPSDLYAERTTRPGAVLLEAEHLSRYGFFHDVSFTLRTNEILGIAGLNGAGRTELARALCGIDPLDEGLLRKRGEELWLESCADAVDSGIAYLTENRKAQGLALRLTVRQNLLSAILGRVGRAGLYRSTWGDALVSGMIGKLRLQPPSPDHDVRHLSGGNQQKTLLGKWLAADPDVLILDEPTRGVDVGAKAIIHEAIAEVADRGRGVLLISSDLPELAGLSDRIIVLHGGHLLGQLPIDGASPERILLAASGETAGLIPAAGVC